MCCRPHRVVTADSLCLISVSLCSVSLSFTGWHPLSEPESWSTRLSLLCPLIASTTSQSLLTLVEKRKAPPIFQLCLLDPSKKNLFLSYEVTGEFPHLELPSGIRSPALIFPRSKRVLRLSHGMITHPWITSLSSSSPSFLTCSTSLLRWRHSPPPSR